MNTFATAGIVIHLPRFYSCYYTTSLPAVAPGLYVSGQALVSL